MVRNTDTFRPVSIAPSAIVNIFFQPEEGYPDAQPGGADLDALTEACTVYLRQWYNGDRLPALVCNGLQVRFGPQHATGEPNAGLNFSAFYRRQG